MPFPLAAIPAIIQGVTSISQLIGGAAKKANRPQYEISDSAKQSLALAQSQATDPYMPGYSQAKTNIDLSAANKIAAAAKYGNAQESLSGIMGQEGAMLRDLGARNEAIQKQNLQNYQGALSDYSQLEDQKWALNKLDPYKDAAAEKRDMVGAGIENLFGSTDKLAQLEALFDIKKRVSRKGLPSDYSYFNAGLGGLTSGVKSSSTTFSYK